MKVLLISFGALVFLGLLLVGSRLWGLSQRYPEFEHPFFVTVPAAPPLVILRLHDIGQIDEALAKKSDLAFWLDVESSLDKKLVVFSREFSPTEMSLEAYHGPNSRSYSLAQLKLLQPTVMELSDVLKRYPDRKFVLNILDNVENIHLWVDETLKELSPEKRLLIQSDYNAVIGSIKELEPFWLYGCAQPDLMRFMAFESMWILPAVPFHGDVFVAPQKIMNRPAYNEDILQEMRRRHKKILLGPVANKEAFDYASRLKPDGMMIENLSGFLSWSRP